MNVRPIASIFAALSLCIALTGCHGMGHASRQIGPWKVAMISTEWFGEPFGSFMTIGNNKVMLHKDFAILRVAMRVENTTRVDRSFSLQFALYGGHDDNVSPLFCTTKGYAAGCRNEVKVAAGTSRTVYFAGSMTPLDQLRGQEPLKVVYTLQPKQYTWPVAALPNHADFYGAKKRSTRFSYRLTEQNWQGVPKGTKLSGNGLPPDAFVGMDVAGLTVTMDVINVNPKDGIFRLPAAILVDSTNEPVALLRVQTVSNHTKTDLGDSGIALKRRQSVVVRLSSPMKEYAKLKLRQPMHIEVPAYRWSVALRRIPDWAHMSKCASMKSSCW